MGAVRRHCVPCPEVCIVDIFRTVGLVRQNIHGDLHTVCAVFAGGFMDGSFIALPIQFDDLDIVHVKAPFFKVPSAYNDNFFSVWLHEK